MIIKQSFSLPTAVIIIDFDNFIPGDLTDISSNELEGRLKGLVRSALDESSEVETILIRLYGGWYKKESFTDRASALQQKLAAIKIFPYIDLQTRSFVRGKIELATTLVDLPRVVWHNTLVERDGISRVRIDRTKLTQACEVNKSSCPIKILENFTKKKNKLCKTLSCTVIHKDAIKGVGQKMVDNMIACDFLTITSDFLAKVILFVSDDTDHFPSILLGASNVNDRSRKIILGVYNKSYQEQWGHLFSDLKEIKFKILSYDN